MSKLNHLFIAFTLTGFLTTVSSGDVLAQRTSKGKDTPLVTDILAEKPAPSLGLPEKIEILSFPKMSFGEENKYFNDITTIQYQISLLNVLIERQRKNKEIQTSMSSIGIPYKEPSPSQSTCAELPKNKLCTKFYPNLYSTRSKPVEMSMGQDSFQDFINKRTLPETKEVVKPVEPVKPKTTVYLWTDITCVFDTCRVVLIPENGGSRFSAKVGDSVGSNYTVETISKTHVDLKNNSTGETIKLQPAPSSATGGSSSPLITSSTGEVFSTTPVTGAEDVDGIIDSLKTEKEIKTVP